MDTCYNKINKFVIFLGDKGTGKTCILQRYLKNKFEENHIETFGKSKYNFYRN
jgi:GTPase SAR1 family protein